MSLFHRKNKEEKTSACACNVGCIKVLGSGCKSCHALLEAVRSMGFIIEVEYITDMEKIMQYGVMSMPALVVNEQVVSMGKVLKSKEVETLIWRTTSE